MKVLFAVNNDEISSAIVKEYQKEYREILSYKNVYYFNAILKELQKDKNYDRVVISEDLEPFANNNYDTIDKFLFEKLKNISDEIQNGKSNNTDIILICTDRRNKSDEMLTKIFEMNIYSAIIGKDRSVQTVCNLINTPRTKREAKQYYKVETDSFGYQSENEDSVSETEVQNILAYYKRLGKNEDKYVDSFNNIVSQYTDKQLKIIIRYLPLAVKAVLEEKSPKYQQLVSFDNNSNDIMKNKKELNNYKEKTKKAVKTKQKDDIKLFENEPSKARITKPIVVPSGVNASNVKKLIKQNKTTTDPINNNETDSNYKFDFKEIEETSEIEEVINEPKRGRGRPRKNPIPTEEEMDKPKRGRGRPRKNSIPEDDMEEKQNEEELIDLFELENDIVDTATAKSNRNSNSEDEEDTIDLFNIDEDSKEDIDEEDAIDLFNMDEDSEKDIDEEDAIDLFNMDEDSDEDMEKDEEDAIDLFNISEDSKDDDFDKHDEEPTDVIATQYKQINPDFNRLLTKDKKVVSFVGTTKNGTSFIVNNVAHMLASMGIQTAILDMTKTRNAYYIYTNSEEKLMQTAKKSIYKLRSGIAEGIRINKNLVVYTTVPGDDSNYSDVDAILGTLIKNYSVVLIDCDFDTPIEYFGASQEIYLVQSMDVLTIQPLTAFLRDLQSKGVLRQEKLKVVINKSVNIKSVSIKTLIGGISKYNDPSLTVMKDLFDKDKINYCTIPFELQNYTKYLDSLITCTVSLNGYTKSLIEALKELANMIYPLLNRQVYSPIGNKYKDNFSSEMNNTLNKMKRKYQ